MQTINRDQDVKTWGGLPPLAWALVGLTVVLSLAWSHVRLMWVDEFLAYYSDSVPTFRDVLNVQLHYPLGIEPPAYHFMNHAAMGLFGKNAFALRLPALFGFLLFQICIYVFVNRISGQRSALIAMVFPLITSTVFRSLDARPYGLMMGFFALALVLWQSAIRAEGRERSRLPILIGLWLAIAVGIQIHYFGVLVLAPLGVAELCRTIGRKRLDKGVAATLVLGALSVGLIVPFLGATKIYRQHYYPAPPTTIHLLLELYRGALTDLHSPAGHMTQMIFLAALAIFCFAGFVVRLRRRTVGAPVYEGVALLTLALLPAIGIVLEVTVTHTMLPRYVLPTAFAFAAGVGIVLQGAVRRADVFYGIFVVLLLSGIGVNVWNIKQDKHNAQEILASCTPTPAVRAELDRTPGQPIYVQTFSQYMVFSYYAPDADVRSRLTLLIDKEQLKYEDADNIYYMTVNLKNFFPLPIVSYEDFLQLHDPLLLFYTQADDKDVWIDKDLKALGRQLTVFGPWMQGYLAQVHSGPAASNTP